MLALSVLAACSALEGAPCGGSVGSCDGTTESLFCLDGRITRIRCDGPRGCSEQGSRLYCDQSVATVGARCAQEAGGACTPDRSEFLTCTGGLYVLSARCHGANACRNVDGQVFCDQTRAAVGDPCATGPGGDAACSMEGDAMLRCREGRFALSTACRGPNACRVQGTQVLCDQSVALAGDPCASEGGGVCTPDGRAMLLCRGGAFGEVRPCRGARGCHTEGSQILCDHSIGALGEPCSPEGAWACDADGRRSLVCRGGTFQEGSRCPRSCTVQDRHVSCR